MIRLQFFEGLIALLPVILLALVSILLRARAAGRRRRQEQSDGSELRRQGAKRQAAPAVPPAPTDAARPGAQSPVETAPGPFGPSKPRTAKPSYRESYAYPPPLAPNRLKGMPEAVVYRESPARKALAGSETYMPLSAQAEVRRMRFEKFADGDSGRGGRRQRAMQAAREARQRLGSGKQKVGPSAAAPGRTAAAAGGKSRSVVDRLNRLPPLQRAVVWSEILGPPGGRQQ